MDIRDTEWQRQGSCAIGYQQGTCHPDDFFLEGRFKRNSVEYRQAVGKAKAICSGCKVRSECLNFALRHDEREGIWGGTTASERQQIKYPRRRINGRLVRVESVAS